MKKIHYCLSLLLFGAALISVGCENIALIGRDSIATGSRGDRSDGTDLVGTVENIDTRAREITLRTTEGRTRRVNYNADTKAIIRGREYPVTELRRDDMVEVQILRDSRGSEYINLVRVRDRDRGPSTAERSSVDRPTDRLGRVQTIEGTVERVDIDRGYFEVNPRFGSGSTRVYLPYNPGRGTVDQFRRLREGDYVRLEGETVSDNRLELKAFL